MIKRVEFSLKTKAMGQRLKRWESPRRQGRNDKGKGGSARARQLKKQQQMLRKKLKANSNQAEKGREVYSLPLFFRKIGIEEGIR